MKAPRTSIFLIAELSNGYGLFIPLMITACISFAVDYYLDPDSIYTNSCARELLTHDKDQSVFVFLKLDELMETDFLRIEGELHAGRHRIFHFDGAPQHLPRDRQLPGICSASSSWTTCAKTCSNARNTDIRFPDYMIQPPDKILEHEAIQSVVQKFEDKHTWMLPVVDKQNRYMGFISKSRILNAYREQLVKIQQ